MDDIIRKICGTDWTEEQRTRGRTAVLAPKSGAFVGSMRVH